MVQEKKCRRKVTGATIPIAVASIGVWMVLSYQISCAQSANNAFQPSFIARGYIEAPTGTAVVAGDPAGGVLLVELRVKEGQKVKKDELVGVLSNYHRSDTALRLAEADLTKLKLTHDSVLKGVRVDEIDLQEAKLKSMIEQAKLANLRRARSRMPRDQKEMEAALAEQDLERQKAKLELLKTTLVNDLQQYKIDLTNAEAKIDSARRTRALSLVRSPLDGVVVQVGTRQGERVGPAGIVKIVNMDALRILADVDELRVGRLLLGGKVDVTFRGDNEVFKGTIERIAPTVKRMQRLEPDGGSSTDARVVQVEIRLDDTSVMPQIVGREARVVFQQSL